MNKLQYDKQSCDSGTIEKPRPPAGSNTNAPGSREMKGDPTASYGKCGRWAAPLMLSTLTSTVSPAAVRRRWQRLGGR